MQTIVVGYDHSEPSKRALERAAMVAKAFGARLVVTSVAPILHSSPRTVGPVDPTDSLGHHIEELAEARAYLEGRGVEAEYLPDVGAPAKAITMLADERDADLIIVGTSEPGLVDRLVRPSVSQSVARHAHRDVLIVHPD